MPNKTKIYPIYKITKNSMNTDSLPHLLIVCLKLPVKTKISKSR